LARCAVKISDRKVFFSYVPLATCTPADHPLRAIRSLADEALPAEHSTALYMIEDDDR
jgi:hypothetical protein